MPQKKGCIPWNKGIKHTKKTKEKIREAQKGNKNALGCKHNKKVVKKRNLDISIAMKKKCKNGYIPKNLFKISHKINIGYKHSEKAKIKISKAHIGKKLGKNNPMWKGGITPLRPHIRNSFKYKQWRNNVFIRDNYTCQICGIKNDYLEAHHIKVFSKMLEEYKIKTLEEALECEELWNINNGLTLCLKCHKIIHKYMKEITKITKELLCSKNRVDRLFAISILKDLGKLGVRMYKLTEKKEDLKILKDLSDTIQKYENS